MIRNIPQFALGQVLITPAALAELERAGQRASAFLDRHARCDWGDIDGHDWQANDEALTAGTRLLSAYSLTTKARIWIITEADRSATTILTPEEY